MGINSNLIQLKTRDDVIGAQSFMKKLDGWIDDSKPVIIHGPSGIGKTSISRLILQEKGYTVLEHNCSLERDEKSLKTIFYSSLSKGLVPTAYLLDEIDGMLKFDVLEAIADQSVNPVIMTCNRLKDIPESLQKRCHVERLKRPFRRSVLKRVKEVADSKGIDVEDYSAVSNDVRSSLQVIAGSMGYKSINNFSKIHDILMGDSRDIEKFILQDTNQWLLTIWLMDNADSYMSGRNLYNFYKILQIFDRTGWVEVLRLIKPDKEGRVEFPNYFSLTKQRKKKQKGDVKIGRK